MLYTGRPNRLDKDEYYLDGKDGKIHMNPTGMIKYISHKKYDWLHPSKDVQADEGEKKLEALNLKCEGEE